MEAKRFFIVTLVRHGETMSNRNKIMQGQLDTQLSDVGMEQARLAGRRLKDQHFSHVFSSDLARAANTARQILAENVSTTCPITMEQRLRERGFGWLEGRPFTDFKQAQEESGVPSHLFTPEGGETMEQVSKRARDFFHDLCEIMAEPVRPSTTDSTTNGVEPQQTVSSGSANQMPLLKNTSSGALTDTSNLMSLAPKPQPTDGGSSSSQGQQVETVPSSSSPTTQGLAQAEVCGDNGSVLVVSHGLLLRELKRIILDKSHGELDADHAREAHTVSPNTGVTQVTMAVGYKYGKLKSQCVRCHVINCASHLGGFKDELVAHAVFKGAL